MSRRLVRWNVHDEAHARRPDPRDVRERDGRIAARERGSRAHAGAAEQVERGATALRTQRKVVVVAPEGDRRIGSDEERSDARARSAADADPDAVERLEVGLDGASAAEVSGGDRRIERRGEQRVAPCREAAQRERAVVARERRSGIAPLRVACDHVRSRDGGQVRLPQHRARDGAHAGAGFGRIRAETVLVVDRDAAVLDHARADVRIERCTDDARVVEPQQVTELVRRDILHVEGAELAASGELVAHAVEEHVRVRDAPVRVELHRRERDGRRSLREVARRVVLVEEDHVHGVGLPVGARASRGRGVLDERGRTAADAIPGFDREPQGGLVLARGEIVGARRADHDPDAAGILPVQLRAVRWVAQANVSRGDGGEQGHAADGEPGGASRHVQRASPRVRAVRMRCTTLA